MKTATFIMDVDLGKPTAIQELYRLDPPYKNRKYVIVSALPTVFDIHRPETYIFPANKKGEIVSWGELPGSFQGAMDITKALKGLGYKRVRNS